MRSFPIIAIGYMERRKKNYKAKLLIQGTEIIERRSKQNNICKENWLNDDQEIIDELVRSVGCRHKHWSRNVNAPVCKSHNDFLSLRTPGITVVDAVFLEEYVPPCREIQTLLATNTVVVDSTTVNGTGIEPYINLTFHFKSATYKLIKNVKAFNEESLIGNLGGYVGLFLGIAIWQTAVFVAAVIKRIRILGNKFRSN